MGGGPELSDTISAELAEDPARSPPPEPSAGGLTGALVIVALLVLVACKQIVINALGGDRHSVSIVVEIVVVAYVLLALVVSTVRVQRAPLTINVAPIIIVQTCLLFWWLLVLLLGPGGDWADRLVSFGTDAFFTCLIWPPVMLLRTRRSVAVTAAAGAGALVFISSIGILQWLVPDGLMPSILRADFTVYLSRTAVGTVRVNGLFGNPIEYGLTLSLGVMLLYVSLSARVTSFRLTGIVIGLIAIIMAGSRAAWLSTAIGLVLLTAPRRLPLIAVPAAIMLAATATLLPEGYWTAYFDKPLVYAQSDTHRVNSILDALSTISSSPIVGSGLGLQNGFSSDATKVVTDGFWWALMLEGGIPGLLLVLALGAAILTRFTRGLHQDESSKKWCIAGLTALSLLAANGFINSWLTNQSASIAYYLIVGLCLAGLNTSIVYEVRVVPDVSRST